MSHPFMSVVLKALRKGIKFTDHAFQVMYSAERMVTVDEVVEAARDGDIIENYLMILVGTAALYWASLDRGGRFTLYALQRTNFLL